MIEAVLLCIDVACLLGCFCAGTFFSRDDSGPLLAFRWFFIFICSAFAVVLLADLASVAGLAPVDYVKLSLAGRGLFGIGVWVLVINVLRMRRKNGGSNGR